MIVRERVFVVVSVLYLHGHTKLTTVKGRTSMNAVPLISDQGPADGLCLLGWSLVQDQIGDPPVCHCAACEA